MAAAENIAANNPGGQLIVAPRGGNEAPKANESAIVPTVKDPRADSLGCASFGDDARCSACDNNTSEFWSLCMCNDRICYECMINFQILEKTDYCATCGDTADLILTESVELRHADFMIADIFMHDPALGVRYSTKKALQAVIDRLQEVPESCDLWTGRGSTTMAKAFVWYQ
jgi:hypothetical protein